MEANRDVLSTAVNTTLDDLYNLVNVPATEQQTMYTPPIHTINIAEQRSQAVTNQILTGILSEMKKTNELITGELRKTNSSIDEIRRTMMHSGQSRSIPLELKLSTSSLKLPVKFKTEDSNDSTTKHGLGQHGKQMKDYKKAKHSHTK